MYQPYENTEDPRVIKAEARYNAAFDAQQYDLAKTIQLEINFLRQTAAATAGDCFDL